MIKKKVGQREIQEKEKKVINHLEKIEKKKMIKMKMMNLKKIKCI